MSGEVIEWWGLTFTFSGGVGSVTVLDDYDRLKPQYDDWLAAKTSGLPVFQVFGIIRDVDRRRVFYSIDVESVVVVEFCQW